MKRLLIITGCLLLFVSLGLAEEAVKEAPTFWQNIRTKIEKITPKQKPAVTTAVGGVRGTEHDRTELYWKGEEKEFVVEAEEFTAFSEALESAENNDQEKAAQLFENFIKTYPQSLLIADAKQALKELQATRPDTH